MLRAFTAQYLFNNIQSAFLSTSHLIFSSFICISFIHFYLSTAFKISLSIFTMPIVQCDGGPGQVSHTDWPFPASEQHNDRRAHTRTKTLPVFLVGWRVLGSGPTLCGRCVNRTTAWQNTAEGAQTIKAQMPRPRRLRTKRTKQGRCCIESTLTTNRMSAAAFSFLKNVAFSKLLRPSAHLRCFFLKIVFLIWKENK